METKGEMMTREQLAEALRQVMVKGDFAYKEIAGKARRSIATIQRARNGEKLSDRTFERVRLVVIELAQN